MRLTIENDFPNGLEGWSVEEVVIVVEEKIRQDNTYIGTELTQFRFEDLNTARLSGYPEVPKPGCKMKPVNVVCLVRQTPAGKEYFPLPSTIDAFKESDITTLQQLKKSAVARAHKQLGPKDCEILGILEETV